MPTNVHYPEITEEQRKKPFQRSHLSSSQRILWACSWGALQTLQHQNHQIQPNSQRGKCGDHQTISQRAVFGTAGSTKSLAITQKDRASGKTALAGRLSSNSILWGANHACQGDVEPERGGTLHKSLGVCITHGLRKQLWKRAKERRWQGSSGWYRLTPYRALFLTDITWPTTRFSSHNTEVTVAKALVEIRKVMLCTSFQLQGDNIQDTWGIWLPLLKSSPAGCAQAKHPF